MLEALTRQAVGDLPAQLWVFGYGSLVWKYDDIPHTESLVCFARGFKRRAWQGSIDHRGTPEKPGRVVSMYSRADFEQLQLIEKDAEQLPAGKNELWQVCGMAFKVTDEERDKAIDSLNFREKNGYEPLWLPLYSFESHTSPPKLLIERALTYVATPSNSSFLGFATHDQIAQHISTCNGPSGSNLDYIHNLHHALERLGYPDPHLASIVRAASG